MTAYGDALRRASELRAQARDMSLQATRLLEIAGELLVEAGGRSSQLDGNEPLSDAPGGQIRLEYEHELLLAGLAENLYRQRQLRAAHFDKNLFGEPAWDMLLNLFIGRVRGKYISVAGACAVSNSSQVTTLRWLNELIQTGLVECEDPQAERGAALVKLTDAGAEKMRGFLLERQGNSVSRTIESERAAAY